MRVLRVLLWVLAFVAVGGLGFFLGGAGGAAVGPAAAPAGG